MIRKLLITSALTATVVLPSAALEHGEASLHNKNVTTSVEAGSAWKSMPTRVRSEV